MEFLNTLSRVGINLESMVMYLVNFGILLVALSYLLYKPILGFLEKRRKVIEDSVTEADRLKKLFEKEKKNMEEEHARAKEELKAEVLDMKKSLREKEEKVLREIDEKRTAMLEEARKEIEAEKASILRASEAKTLGVIKEVVSYVVQNKVPQDVVAQSVEEAWSHYKS